MKKAKYKVPIHHRFLFSPCSIKSKLFINSLSLANRTCGFFEKILWMGIIVISAWLCCSLLKWTPTGVLVELLFRTVFKWSTIRFSADLFDCPKYCFFALFTWDHIENPFSLTINRWFDLYHFTRVVYLDMSQNLPWLNPSVRAQMASDLGTPFKTWSWWSYWSQWGKSGST